MKVTNVDEKSQRRVTNEMAQTGKVGGSGYVQLPGTREASASALKDPGGCLTQIPRRWHRPNGAWRARVCGCGLVGCGLVCRRSRSASKGLGVTNILCT